MRCITSWTARLWRGSDVRMKKSLVTLMRGHQRHEALRVRSRELLGRDALALGGLRDGLAVLVGAGEEEHLLPTLAHVPRQDVGADRGVRVTQVRRRVDVVDRRRDVVGHRATRR